MEAESQMISTKSSKVVLRIFNSKQKNFFGFLILSLRKRGLFFIFKSYLKLENINFKKARFVQLEYFFTYLENQMKFKIFLF